MNRQLRSLVTSHNLDSEQFQMQRVEFGFACIKRIAHLLIDERLTAVLHNTRLYLSGSLAQASFDESVDLAQKIAQSHAGTNGIDGVGSAAVSATFAVAKALSGDAVNAAEYAAYAAVYSYASHTVTDPSAYEKEYQWQVDTLEKLLTESSIPRVE